MGDELLDSQDSQYGLEGDINGTEYQRYCIIHEGCDTCLSGGLPDTLIATKMQRYIPPIFIAVGTIGNLLLVLVMKQRDFKALSVFVYLRAFVIANTVVLYVSTGVPWACFMASQPYIADWTDWGCRMWSFGANVIGHSPVWFAVAMSIDRFIAVWHPHKSQEICSVFISKIVLIAILIGLTAISVHALWTYELDNGVCIIVQNPGDFHSIAWPWIWDTFYYFLPLFAILVFSMLSLFGVCLKRIPHGLRTPTRPDEREATITTLILVMIFFLFAAPATTVKIVEVQIPVSWLCDQVIMKQFTVTRSLVQMLSILNQCVTFFVLITVSGSYREGLKKLCLDNCYLRRLLRLADDAKPRQEMSSTHVAIEDPCTETTPL